MPGARHLPATAPSAERERHAAELSAKPLFLTGPARLSAGPGESGQQRGEKKEVS